MSEKGDSVAPDPNSVANSLPSSNDSATTSIMSSTSTSTTTISKPSKKLPTAEEEAELVMAQMALKEAERADRLQKREAEAAAERTKQQKAADTVDISDSVLLEAADEMYYLLIFYSLFSHYVNIFNNFIYLFECTRKPVNSLNI